MKVLYAASEGYPFAKTGGLGDVIGSLPVELKNKGLDVRVIMPKYHQISDEFRNKMTPVAEFSVELNREKRYCRIETLSYNEILYYFVDNEYYFKQSSYYGYSDEAEKFIYFSKAILDGLKEINFCPDIIHCHDWHTALVPFLIREIYKDAFYQGIRSILTIHNLKYQGILPKELLNNLLKIENCISNMEFNGYANLLKGGIISADLITTVSPAYAREIQNEYLGEGLESVLKANHRKIRGILNGIDYNLYNPETDKNLYRKYKDSYSEKVLNKIEFQKRYGLKEGEDIPMIAVISRLTEQKGIDLIKEQIDHILRLNLQLVILGVGERRYEQFFKDMIPRYPKKLYAFIQFDEGLSRQIYGAADMVLMPSKFEPCGLTQMIAMRYGAVPIVRATGGLKDSVVSFEKSEQGTGFTFDHYEGTEMLDTIIRAVKIYNQKDKWELVFNNAVHTDLSWSMSVTEYIKAYEEIHNC